MIPNWIDEEYGRRMHGVNRALMQHQHDRVNARYPGATLEYCIDCGGLTDRAGKHDDSLYFEDDDGPYCHPCYSSKREARHG